MSSQQHLVGGVNVQVHYAIDFGSFMIQAGNADHYNSSCDFPSIVGFPKEKLSPPLTVGLSNCSSSMKEMFIGYEALSKMGVLHLEYPIRKGMVQDWGLFETFVEYLFVNACRIDSQEHPLVISDSPFISNNQRCKMIELMFERFNVPGFSMINCAMASCFSSGRTSATILTCGEGRTFVQSIYEGFLLNQSIYKLEIGGHDITENLQQLLNRRGNSFHFK